MIRRWHLHLAFLALLTPSLGYAETPKVLLIGIDGLRSDAFQKASTPHLDELIQNGIVDYQTSVISTDVTKSDTVSGPGWTTYLTGTWADRHGVVDNSFSGRDPSNGPHIFRLAKQAHDSIRTASFVNWTPIDQYVTTDADVNVVVNPPPQKDDSKKKDYAAADRLVASLACRTLEQDQVDLAFVYLGSVDETGHEHGFHPSVDLYTQQISMVDGLVGQLINAVRQRKDFSKEDWLVVMSADHGGEGLGHGGGRDNQVVFTVPMIVSGRAAAKGSDVSRTTSTTDVVAVALQHLKIDHQQDWNLAGNAEGWLQ